MRNRIHTYFFARLSLRYGLQEDREKFLMDAFAAPVSVEEGQFRYRIMRDSLIAIGTERFAFGQLVKYKPLLEAEVVKEETDEIVQSGLPQGVVAISKFFLHFDSLVIAYRPIRSRISERQFKKLFAKLVSKGHDDFFVDAQLDTVDEDLDIAESLSFFKRIWRVATSVRPTNPSNREIYRRVDERLKILNAEKEDRAITAMPDGFNKDRLLDDDAFRTVFLAIDGYGSASIQGETHDGERKTIRTGDNPVTATAMDRDDPIHILTQLFSRFEEIWDRKRVVDED